MYLKKGGVATILGNVLCQKLTFTLLQSLQKRYMHAHVWESVREGMTALGVGKEDRGEKRGGDTSTRYYTCGVCAQHAPAREM